MIAAIVVAVVLLAVVFVWTTRRPSRDERIQLSEGRSRRMEREAGLVFDGESLMANYGPYRKQGSTVTLRG